jgi:hypothetical protein
MRVSFFRLVSSLTKVIAEAAPSMCWSCHSSVVKAPPIPSKWKERYEREARERCLESISKPESAGYWHFLTKSFPTKKTQQFK